MGLFFGHRQPRQPALQLAVREALAAPTPHPDSLDAEAQNRADAIVGPVARRLRVDRFIGAIIIFARVYYTVHTSRAHAHAHHSSRKITGTPRG
jgi:hypothetical protein